MQSPLTVLYANNFGFNLGFYMLLPYLSGHLTGQLGLSVTVAALVLGVRTFCQQGLYLPGGMLADRLDYRHGILGGCALRVVGFALFGLSSTLSGILLAAALTGLAAALFTPASLAYMAQQTRDLPHRQAVYARHTQFGEAGALLGPVLGVALLAWRFEAVCLVAAAVFFLLFLLQWRYLPPQSGSEQGHAAPWRHDWWQPAANGLFRRFTLAMMAYYLCFNQIYLTLPLALPEPWRAQGTTLLFSMSALLGVVLQMPVSRWARHTLGRQRALCGGLLLMGLSFPLLLLPLPGTAALLPPVLAMLLLTTGTLLAYPDMMALIPELAGERQQGTYYGWFYLMAGVGGVLGNTLAGWLWQQAPALACWSLAGLTALATMLAWRTLGSAAQPLCPADQPA